MSKPKVIAFYLPQYHPTPDNDKWWGKGFTEWTNVGKAKPLFPGHYQPKVPADLGYYDLRLPEVREAQAELAREAGVYGFCYYHYWFGNGKQELELPFNEVLRLGKPDFPFMLCWANESWHRKFWNKDGKGSSKEMLIEQTYPEGDAERHFYHLLPAFRDPRYIRIDGKPAFMIYNPNDYPKVSEFISTWNTLAIKEGLPGFHFIAQIRANINDQSVEQLKEQGFDAVNTVGLWNYRKDKYFLSFRYRLFNKIKRTVFHRPKLWDYADVNKFLFSEVDNQKWVYPTIIPNWDHSPRSGVDGYIIHGESPKLFQQQILHAFELNSRKTDDANIVFLKSWNEWGEGNYMEPDMKFGHGFLNALKESFE